MFPLQRMGVKGYNSVKSCHVLKPLDSKTILRAINHAQVIPTNSEGLSGH